MFLRVFLTLVVLAGLGAAAWFWREPLYDRVKAWRSEMLLMQSKNAASEGDAGLAHQYATAAWQLQPGGYPFLRKLLSHAQEIGLGELPAMTVVVFLHPEAKGEDQEGILRWVLERGDSSFFAQLYQSLEGEESRAPGVRLLHAEFLARQGRILEAVEEARALDGEGPEGTEASLLLTALLPRLENNPLAWGQARERILKLMESEEEKMALRAWRNLRLLPAEYRDPGLSFDPVAWIQERKSATPADRLLARQLELARLPATEWAGRLDSIQREFTGDEEALRYLARWFLETGQTERLLSLDPEALSGDAQLFSSRLQALIDSGRLEEAENWLKEAPPGIPGSLTMSLRAALAGKAGREAEALSLWQNVLDTAKGLAEYRDCATILQVAQRFGEARVARQAVDIIVSLPASKMPRSESLEGLEAFFVERPADWLAFWKSVAANRPQDGFAAEQVAFLQLFIPDGVDPAEASRRTDVLWKRYPGILKFRTTHALWLILEGRAEEAVTLLKQAKVNWNQAPDGDRAVFALAQFRAGHDREGGILQQGIRWEAVSPMRRHFLTQVPKQAPVQL